MSVRRRSLILVFLIFSHGCSTPRDCDAWHALVLGHTSDLEEVQAATQSRLFTADPNNEPISLRDASRLTAESSLCGVVLVPIEDDPTLVRVVPGYSVTVLEGVTSYFYFAGGYQEPLLPNTYVVNGKTEVYVGLDYADALLATTETPVADRVVLARAIVRENVLQRRSDNPACADQVQRLCPSIPVNGAYAESQVQILRKAPEDFAYVWLRTASVLAASTNEELTYLGVCLSQAVDPRLVTINERRVRADVDIDIAAQLVRAGEYRERLEQLLASLDACP